VVKTKLVRLHLKCDGTRAETRFLLTAKRTSPFKSAGASVQSTTGSRAVHISLQGLYCSCKPVFCSHVTLTGYPLHSLVSPSLLLSCVTVCHHISNAVYHHQPDLPTAQRECSECQTAIRNDCSHIPLACHTPRHWLCSRTNCSSLFGNTTTFSILFNCSGNRSSLLGCIISIICNASISNHQIRHISNRHAINNVSTWDHRLKRPSLHKQGSIYILCNTLPNVAVRNCEPKHTNNAGNVVCFLLGNSPASEFYMPTLRNTPHLPAYEDGT